MSGQPTTPGVTTATLEDLATQAELLIAHVGTARDDVRRRQLAEPGRHLSIAITDLENGLLRLREAALTLC